MSNSKLSEREQHIAVVCFGRGWYQREHNLIDYLGGCSDEIRRSKDIPTGLAEIAVEDVGKYAEHLPCADAALSARLAEAAELLRGWRATLQSCFDASVPGQHREAFRKDIERLDAFLAKQEGSDGR